MRVGALEAVKILRCFREISSADSSQMQIERVPEILKQIVITIN